MAPYGSLVGRRSCFRALAVLAVAVGGVVASAASASAAGTGRTVSCRSFADAPASLAKSTTCWSVTVPVARLADGTTGLGTIRLAVAEMRRGRSRGGTAILALSGGPGQSAIPFLPDVAYELRAVHLPLISIDQRGTGASGVIDCPTKAPSTPSFAWAAQCAARLGARAGWYRSDDSAADIEAVRRALGYSKLIVYGVSYGTYVAQRYAAAYPDRVAKLVLDSPVPVNNPAFEASSYVAIRRVLGDLCRRSRCTNKAAYVTQTGRFLQALRLHPASATTTDSRGRRHSIRIGVGDVLGILYAGDFDYRERAWLPAAMANADAGDYRLLARLVQINRATSNEDTLKTFSPGLNLATSCTDQTPPWPTGVTDPAARLAVEDAALQGLGEQGFFNPFAWQDFSSSSALRDDCAAWPAPPRPLPVVVTALPQVPTLILVGTADLRTPIENLASMAALLPHATVISVRGLGHDVASSPCAVSRAAAWLLGRRPHCGRRPTILDQPLSPLPTVAQLGSKVEALLFTLGVARDDAYEPAYGSLVDGTARLHLYHARAARKGCAAPRAYGIDLAHYSAFRGFSVSGQQNIKLTRRGTCTGYTLYPTTYPVRAGSSISKLQISLDGTYTYIDGRGIHLKVRSGHEEGIHRWGGFMTRQAVADYDYYHSQDNASASSTTARRVDAGPNER